MFSDGSLLTAADVVASLQSLLPAGLQLTATDTASPFTRLIPFPICLEQLASAAILCFARCLMTRFSALGLSTSPKSAPPLPTKPTPSLQSPRA